MVQNLRLVGSRTLTSANSDVTSNFTLPASAGGNWGEASDSLHLYDSGNTNYGVYYNWYTATAGTGTGSMTSVSATNLTNASSSICPKGWRLPDGGQSTIKAFYQLDRVLGGTGANRTDVNQKNKFITAPYDFVFAGSYAGQIWDQGSFGHLWSRSASTNAGNPFYFSLRDGGYIAPQGTTGSIYGLCIRCVNK